MPSTDLAKARLFRLKGEKEPTVEGGPILVQFNPSSLHVVISSATDGPGTPARQAEQSLGAGNQTLTLDLHFDTADEGTTTEPRNVREKTALVAQFMTPARGSSAPPPRVRFQWGKFIVDGVMGSYSEDLDLFSAQGVPLRAKVSISIRGQNPDIAANRTGAGAGTGAGATLAGSVGAGAVGTLGLGASLSAGVGLSAGVSTGVALGGESAAEFAAR